MAPININFFHLDFHFSHINLIAGAEITRWAPDTVPAADTKTAGQNFSFVVEVCQ